MTISERKWIGKDVARLEDPRLLAGRATYTDDVQLAGMLQAAVLRSPQTCQAVLTQLGAQVRRLTEQHADFVFLDLPGRIAKALLKFAGDTTPSSIEISQTTLARLVGGARQTVNEVIMQFARRNWLHVEPGRMIIIDADALRRRCGQVPVGGATRR